MRSVMECGALFAKPLPYKQNQLLIYVLFSLSSFPFIPQSQSMTWYSRQRKSYLVHTLFFLHKPNARVLSWIQ